MDVSTLKNRRTRRTTLTLEADVADYLENKLAGNRKLREKNLINELLRKGIQLDEREEIPEFNITPFRTDLAPGMTVARLEEMIDEI